MMKRKHIITGFNLFAPIQKDAQYAQIGGNGPLGRFRKLVEAANAEEALEFLPRIEYLEGGLYPPDGTKVRVTLYILFRLAQKHQKLYEAIRIKYKDVIQNLSESSDSLIFQFAQPLYNHLELDDYFAISTLKDIKDRFDEIKEENMFSQMFEDMVRLYYERQSFDKGLFYRIRTRYKHPAINSGDVDLYLCNSNGSVGIYECKFRFRINKIEDEDIEKLKRYSDAIKASRIEKEYFEKIRFDGDVKYIVGIITNLDKAHIEPELLDKLRGYDIRLLQAHINHDFYSKRKIILSRIREVSLT